MAKKYWISIPLCTASEANDAAVVSFLKGGLKKELEAEVAAFITKWMLDKSVPFLIAVESSSPERNLVLAPAPQASQNAPGGVTVPVVAEAGKVVDAQEVAEHGADTAVEQIVEGAAVPSQPAGEPTEAVNDEPASQLNAPGDAGLGRARGKSKRRVPEASNA